MYVIGHIGKIPVEEWLPFVFPVLALYLYGRHWARRRREAVRRLPEASSLDERTIDRILARWAAAEHREVLPEHLAVLYPPGPDGASVAELAARTHCEQAVVRGRLEDLAELGYLTLEGDGTDEQAWLTVEGHDLVGIAEDVLLATGPDGALARGPSEVPS